MPHPALFLLLLCIVGGTWGWSNGVVFGGGEWTAPGVALDSETAIQSLDDAISHGCTSIKIPITWYTPYFNSTRISPANGPTPIATPTEKEVAGLVAAAKEKGLEVMVAPMVDPDWRNPKNLRKTSEPYFPGVECEAGREKSCGGIPTSRGLIGCLGTNWERGDPWTCTGWFTDAQWEAWFMSYSSFVVPLAKTAQEMGVDAFCTAAELDVVFQKAPSHLWQELHKDIKQVFSGKLTVAVNPNSYTSLPPFVNFLDFVGVDAYYSLSPPNETVAGLVQAWQPYVEMLQNLSQTAWLGKPVGFTEVGTQSRPGSYQSPPGTERFHPEDCSVEFGCIDIEAQTMYYEALYETWKEKEWWVGVWWWLWRSDNSAGGMSDASFSPQHKPASNVMLANSPSPLNPPPPTPLTPSPSPPPSIPSTCENRTKAMVHGVVFGSGEWTARGLLLNSSEAFASLANAQEAGVTHVQLIPTQFFPNVSSTTFYPLPSDSPMRTTTDEEMMGFGAEVNRRGMKLSISLMLDPDLTLTNGHRQGGSRADLGASWTTQQEFDAFWSLYSKEVLHTATLCSSLPACVEVLIGHELHALFIAKELNSHWAQLAHDTRDIVGVGRKVSIAFNGNPFFTDFSNNRYPYIDTLDSIGLDCYWPLKTASLPATTWEVVALGEVVNAWQDIVKSMEQVVEETNKSITCTEIGFQSRPWAWWRGLNDVQPDGVDESVWTQAINLKAQALAYNASYHALSPHDWFNGFYWWVWRSDPTAGGTSDDSYTPQGKPAQQILSDWSKC